MKFKDLKNFFNSSVAFKKATGMSRSNYTYWQRIGYIPIESQYRIECITKGKLKANWQDIPLNKRKF